MTQFKRVLAALDLSKADAPVLKFASLLSEPFKFTHLYFFHAIPDFSMPRHLDAEFYKLFSPEYPIDEKVKAKLELDLAGAFDKLPGITQSVEVIEGNPYEKLLHWIKVKMIDLLIVGHKENSSGSGVTAKRLARNIEIPILFVSETFHTPVQKIVVPVDFSKLSYQALQTALHLASQMDGAKVISLYVIGQPSAVYYDPTSGFASLRKLLRESAEDTFHKFSSHYHLDESTFEQVFIEDDRSSISGEIYAFAKEQEASLIVTGAKGHTALNTLFFGSVTESLLERCKGIPILVVR